MHVDAAIRGRRTAKTFDPTPVPLEVLEELFELARWAPNHRLTQPWRFRVLGREAFRCLCEVAGDGAAKLHRAPTLVVASYMPSPLPLHADEDALAAACAAYAVLLGATARGLASYWRTPAILRTSEGREACGVPEGERVLGLLHLGWPAGELPAPPERVSTAHFVEHLP